MAEIVNAIVNHLLDQGWSHDGATRAESYRTHSLAFGGGPIAHTGGRMRLKKGDNKITVGPRTIVVYKKPEEPDIIPDRGRLIGQKVYTFRDWPMRNVQVKSKKAGGAAETIKELDRVIEEFNKQT